MADTERYLFHVHTVRCGHAEAVYNFSIPDQQKRKAEEHSGIYEVIDRGHSKLL